MLNAGGPDPRQTKPNPMRKIFLSSILFLCISAAKAQSDSTAFGQTIFGIFKSGSLDELRKYRLSTAELISFLVSAKVDTSAANIKTYISKYPAISEAFYQKCEEIVKDTLKYPDWKIAELGEVRMKKQEIGPPGSKTKQSDLVYDLHIIIMCNNKTYLLLFDVISYNGKWLLGNSVNCFLPGYDW